MTMQTVVAKGDDDEVMERCPNCGTDKHHFKTFQVFSDFTMYKCPRCRWFVPIKNEKVYFKFI